MSTLPAILGPELVAAIEQLVDERVQAALDERMQIAVNGTPWLSLSEAASYMRVSERTIQRQVRRKRIRPYTGLGRPLFHRDELVKAATGEDVAPTTSPRRREE